MDSMIMPLSVRSVSARQWKDAGLDRSTIFIQTKFGIDYSFGENDGGANGYDFSAKHPD